MIKKEGDKYLLYSEDGSKLLGSFDSKKEAEAAWAKAKEGDAFDSLEGRAHRVRLAWEKRHETELGSTGYSWPVDVFQDYLIVSKGADYFRVPYTMAADGAVTFGEAERVDVQYVPVTETSVEIREPKGEAWLVRVIRAGFSKQPKPVPPAGIEEPVPWYYTAEAIKGAVEVFEGAPVYAFEVAPRTHGHLALSPDEKTRKGLVKHLVGTISGVKEAAGELLARLDLLKGSEWLKDKLTDLAKKGRSDLVGLSIDSRVQGVPVQTAEGRAFAVLRFVKPATVDVATHPAAGGAFLRALESLGAQEATMLKELLERLRKRRPDIAARLGDTPTDAAVQEAFDEAFGTAQPQGLSPAERALLEVQAAECRILLRDQLEAAKLPEKMANDLRRKFEGRIFKASELEAVVKEAQALHQMAGTRCNLILRDRLAGAKLPKPVEDKIRKRFEGEIFEESVLEAVIKEEKELLDALTQEGHITGLGATKAAVLLEQTAKHQIAMDRMIGAETKESEKVSPKDVPAFRSFRDAFYAITGKNLVDMLNHPIADGKEAILSTTWVNVLGTSMHRRLIKDYQAVEYFEDAIRLPRPGGIPNFKTMEAERVKYFVDLSEFDTEAADFPEIAAPGDEKVSYVIVQKGNILTISRKTLINDDLGAVTKMVGRLGRAARRTHARFVWNFWRNNVAYEVDALAWFHATHANLQTVALTADFAGATEIMSAITKLADQAEPGSGEKLGISLQEPMWLAVPHALLGVAVQLNIAPQVPSGANLVANPVYHRFGMNNERVVLNPLFTDTNDWGISRSPEVVDSLEVGYLNDQREPEFLVANVPTVGQMFVADKQQFKVRHEYGGDILDFRGAVKAVVP